MIFRTVQSLAPFVAGWFFVFNIVRPDNTPDEAFVEFAKSEVPDAKHLLGHDATIYCFVPTSISLEEIKVVLDNQDVLPGTAKLFYLTSVSNFNDMLRVLDKSATPANCGKLVVLDTDAATVEVVDIPGPRLISLNMAELRALAKGQWPVAYPKSEEVKCGCALCGVLDGRASDAVKEFMKSIRISAIPYNEQTRAVVRKFFDSTIASKKTPTVEDMRELRAGLVAVIGEEAVNAAGMTPIPEATDKPSEA